MTVKIIDQDRDRTAGRDGHIFADGKSYLIVIMTGESVRRWKNVKKRLSFCRISQGGDDEGCLHLGRLPTAHEADLIRGANVTCHRKH
jgi:hypothetical protein